MKTCATCGDTKSLDEFNNHRKSKDGKQSSCRQCERQYKLDNAERKRETDAAYWKANRLKRLRQKREYYREVIKPLREDLQEAFLVEYNAARTEGERADLALDFFDAWQYGMLSKKIEAIVVSHLGE